VASISFFIPKAEKEDFGKSSVYLRMTTKGRGEMIETSNTEDKLMFSTISDLIRTTDKPNREYAHRILESWLDSQDPTAEYYVASIPAMERALSWQSYDGKRYACILATIGGRSCSEAFLIPATFWQETERDLIFAEADDDAYGQWASAGYPKSDRFEF